MNYSTCRQAGLALILLAGSASSAKAAVDPADLAFWQSIQNSTDPAEYRAYLDTFPHGVFEKLARIRANRADAAAPVAAAPAFAPAPPPIPAPTSPPAPIASAPEPPAAPEDDTPPPPEHIAVNPATGRVGQLIAFTCENFPDPTSYDVLAVVPAGTPEADPTRAKEDTKMLWTDYAVNCKRNGSVKGGPFPPGKYEVRFITQLYNSDRKYEVKAHAPFTIR